MSKLFKLSTSLIVSLVLFVSASFASNVVKLNPEYFPSPSIGRALSGAQIYVGIVDLDPKIPANQKTLSVLQENGTTVAVTQPLTTGAGGVPLYNGSPVTMLVDGPYSLRVDDSTGTQIYYVPESAVLSEGVVLETKSVAAMQAETALSVGDVVQTTAYYSTSDGGSALYEIVAAGTGTDNGGAYIDLPGSGLQAKLTEATVIDTMWGVKHDAQEADRVQNTTQLQAYIDWAAPGSTVNLSAGTILVTQLVNPPDLLHYKGVGIHLDVKANLSGTVIQGSLSPVIYFPPPVVDGFNRHSSMRDLSVYGDGVTDDDGTITCIKINNQGLDLVNVTTRYGFAGIDCNNATGQRWEKLILRGSNYGVLFRYDPNNPIDTSNAGQTSWSTASTYKDISCNTSVSIATAIGWYVDATCQYGQNTHINIDAEHCYTGMVFEGRVASKDYQTTDLTWINVFGASGWKSSGNVFIGSWFEVNTGYNVKLIADSAAGEPILLFESIYQDSSKIIALNPEGTSDNLVYKARGIEPLINDTEETGSGSVGTFSSPLTANQYLFNGPKVNTPLLRELLKEKVPYYDGNRGTENWKSVYEFSVFIPAIPEVGSKINVANIDLFDDNKAAVLEITAVAMSNTGGAAYTKGEYLVSNIGDAISQTTLREDYTSTKVLSIVAERVDTNTFGIFVYRETAASTYRATYNIKVVVSGGSAGAYESTFTPLLQI